MRAHQFGGELDSADGLDGTVHCGRELGDKRAAAKHPRPIAKRVRPVRIEQPQAEEDARARHVQHGVARQREDREDSRAQGAQGDAPAAAVAAAVAAAAVAAASATGQGARFEGFLHIRRWPPKIFRACGAPESAS